MGAYTYLTTTSGTDCYTSSYVSVLDYGATNQWKHEQPKEEGGYIGPMRGENVRWLEGRVDDMRVQLQ